MAASVTAPGDCLPPGASGRRSVVALGTPGFLGAKVREVRRDDAPDLHGARCAGLDAIRGGGGYVDDAAHVLVVVEDAIPGQRGGRTAAARDRVLRGPLVGDRRTQVRDFGLVHAGDRVAELDLERIGALDGHRGHASFGRVGAAKVQAAVVDLEAGPAEHLLEAEVFADLAGQQPLLWQALHGVASGPLADETRKVIPVDERSVEDVVQHGVHRSLHVERGRRLAGEELVAVDAQGIVDVEFEARIGEGPAVVAAERRGDPLLARLRDHRVEEGRAHALQEDGSVGRRLAAGVEAFVEVAPGEVQQTLDRGCVEARREILGAFAGVTKCGYGSRNDEDGARLRSTSSSLVLSTRVFMPTSHSLVW